jgi:hypothetical protein
MTLSDRPPLSGPEGPRDQHCNHLGPDLQSRSRTRFKTVSHVDTALCSNARVARVMSQLMPRSPNCRIAFSR